MASVSATHMILFIASMLVAASVAGVLTDQVSNLSQAINQQGLDASKDVRTDIEIISDSGSSNIYDNTTANITLYVKNTGSQRLEPNANALDVLVDGKYEASLNVTVIGDSVWDPNDVAEVVIDLPSQLSGGGHRVKVIANGDEEVFEFRV